MTLRALKRPALCILLGSLTTLAVAWTCALLSGDDDEEIKTCTVDKQWYVHARQGFGRARLRFVRDSEKRLDNAFPDRVVSAFHLERTGNGPENLSGTAVYVGGRDGPVPYASWTGRPELAGAGWPVPCLASFHELDESSGPKDRPTDHSAIRVLSALAGPFQERRRNLSEGALPVWPLTHGLAADVALYSAIWYALTLPIVWLRARRRRRRGCCPRCDHDLREMPAGSNCPGCGRRTGPRARRRTLRRLALCTALGAATSVALAWLCAAREIGPVRPASLSRSDITGWTASESRRFGRTEHSFLDLAHAEALQRAVVAMFGPADEKSDDERAKADPPEWLAESVTLGGLWSADAVLSGWPARCAWSWHRRAPGAPGAPVEDSLALRLTPPSNGLSGLRRSWPNLSDGSLPIGIIASGLLIDTAAHGAAWWALLFGPMALRRWRRRRAGRCERCGYDLRGLPAGNVCPECGSAPDAGAPAPTARARTRPTPRLARLVAICLAFGLVTTLLSAAAIAALPRLGRIVQTIPAPVYVELAPGRPVRVYTIEEAAIGWRRASAASAPEEPLDPAANPIPSRSDRARLPWWVHVPPQGSYIQTEAVGLPWPCLAAWRDADGSHHYLTLHDPRLWPNDILFPTHPVYPAFVLDTAAFGAAWYLLLAGPHLLHLVRRRHRLRRGRCPSCGYDLLGKLPEGCPECGWGRAP